MKNYLDALKDVIKYGDEREDRTGTGTFSLFGYELKYNLSNGFPLLTTKKMFWKGIVYELLWFISGDTNIKYLNDNGVHIWDEWADENGDLGPIYGKQLRSWTGSDGKVYDQLSNLIKNIKSDKCSRRHLMTLWKVDEIHDMSLPPCHGIVINYSVREGDQLDCIMYQRSCDLFLGVPFNIASYSLLLMMISKICNLDPGYLIMYMGDVHIYKNHIEQAMTQIKREPLELPTVEFVGEQKCIEDFNYDNIILKNYKHHGKIEAEISV